MEKISLSDYLEPFTNISSYLKAVHIVQSNLSEIKKDYTLVAKLILDLVDKSLKLVDIVNFIQRIEILPNFYGLEFCKQQTQFLNDVHQHQVNCNTTTIVMNTTRSECIFCPNSTLIFKPIRFAKNPLVFSRTKVGKIQVVFVQLNCLKIYYVYLTRHLSL